MPTRLCCQSETSTVVASRRIVRRAVHLQRRLAADVQHDAVIGDQDSRPLIEEDARAGGAGHDVGRGDQRNAHQRAAFRPGDGGKIRLAQRVLHLAEIFSASCGVITHTMPAIVLLAVDEGCHQRGEVERSASDVSFPMASGRRHAIGDRRRRGAGRPRLRRIEELAVEELPRWPRSGRRAPEPRPRDWRSAPAPRSSPRSPPP